MNFSVQPLFLATKTIEAINSAIEWDQGATFRKNLGKVIGSASDAYDPENKPFRKHLGASLIGRECSRELWYSFRWTKTSNHDGQLLRLFNRGHLEEPRFVAMLMTIGCEVWQYDSEGKQFRLKDHNGHFGGSLDTVLRGVPDLPGEAILGEFKTHGEKSYHKLESEGVRASKYEHYVQMQMYMGAHHLRYALYLAVNKNTDELYGEIITFDKEQYDQFTKRAHFIIYSEEPPVRINNSPGWFKCKFCDYNRICHYGDPVERNCRTCTFSKVGDNSTWLCIAPMNEGVLSEETQLKGCPLYQVRKM